MSKLFRTYVTRLAATFVVGAILAAGGAQLVAQSNVAIRFNGAGQRVDIPTSADFMNPSLITVECWARPADGSDGRLVSKGDGVDAFSSRSWALSWVGQHYEWDIFLSMATGYSKWATLVSTYAYNVGEFHHVAGTFNAVTGTARLYVDGKIAAETFTTTDGAPLTLAHIRQCARPVRIAYEDPVATNYFNGTLDAVRIWKVERSQSDIADTMAFELAAPHSGLVASYALNGNAHDSAGSHNGSFVGVPMQTSATWAFAAAFGGPYGFIQNPALASPAQLTAEAWVYPVAGTTGRIFSLGDGQSVYSTRTLEVSWTNTQFTAEVFTGPVGTNGYALAASPSTYASGTWHHVAATYSGIAGELRLYVDGELVAMTTTAGTGGPGSLAGTTLRAAPQYALLIGNDVNGLAFPGSIDEIRVWNVARTPNEIRTCADRMLDHEPGQVASMHLSGDFVNTTGTLGGGTSFAFNYSPTSRVRSFHVSATLGLGGAIDLSAVGVPASTVEGWTVASFDTSSPVGEGLAFGINPDTTTWNLVAMAPIATAGQPIHWTWPTFSSAYPNVAFSMPAGQLPSGLTIDLLAVAVSGAGALTPTPVSRVTTN